MLGRGPLACRRGSGVTVAAHVLSPRTPTCWISSGSSEDPSCAASSFRSAGSLAGAQSFEDYTNALAQLARSPFASVAQRGGAAAIDHLKEDQTALLGELLLPGCADWSSLTNLPAWRTKPMPETPTAHEKDVYFNLRDDKNMRNVYAYQLIANSHPNNPFQTHPVFAQGLIATNRLGRRAGLSFDPSVSRDCPQFTQQSYDDSRITADV